MFPPPGYSRGRPPQVRGVRGSPGAVTAGWGHRNSLGARWVLTAPSQGMLRSQESIALCWGGIRDNLGLHGVVGWAPGCPSLERESLISPQQEQWWEDTWPEPGDTWDEPPLDEPPWEPQPRRGRPRWHPVRDRDRAGEGGMAQGWGTGTVAVSGFVRERLPGSPQVLKGIPGSLNSFPKRVWIQSWIPQHRKDPLAP